MKFAICIVPVTPLRSEPSHKSEMISQLIFGEAVIITESNQEGWVKLRNQYDHYEGWVTQSQLAPIEETLYLESTEDYTTDFISTIDFSGHPMRIPLGSFLKGIRHGEMKWGKYTASFEGNPYKPNGSPITEKSIRQFAFQFLNTPYLWGGRTIFGVDCSGFTQTIFRLLGKPLPRDAYMQAQCGESLKEGLKPHCGDLAFFKNKEGKITHVGLMLNDFEIIHAAGKVRVDKLDDYGIQNIDTGTHSHQLAFIRRFF